MPRPPTIQLALDFTARRAAPAASPRPPSALGVYVDAAQLREVAERNRLLGEESRRYGGGRGRR